MQINADQAPLCVAVAPVAQLQLEEVKPGSRGRDLHPCHISGRSERGKGTRRWGGCSPRGGGYRDSGVVAEQQTPGTRHHGHPPPPRTPPAEVPTPMGRSGSGCDPGCIAGLEQTRRLPRIPPGAFPAAPLGGAGDGAGTGVSPPRPGPPRARPPPCPSPPFPSFPSLSFAPRCRRRRERGRRAGGAADPPPWPRWVQLGGCLGGSGRGVRGGGDATLMSLGSPGAGDEGDGDAAQPAEALGRQHHLHQLHPAAGEGPGGCPPPFGGWRGDPRGSGTRGAPAPAPHKLGVTARPLRALSRGVWGRVRAGLGAANPERGLKNPPEAMVSPGTRMGCVCLRLPSCDL